MSSWKRRTDKLLSRRGCRGRDSLFRCSGGSLTLEAAVITPVLALVLVVLILTLYARLAQFCWNAALYKAGNELSLTAIAAHKALSHLPMPAEVASQVNRIPPKVRGVAVDAGLSFLTGGYIGGRVNDWYERTVSPSRLLPKLLKNRRFSVSWEPENHVLWIHSYYDIPLGIGTIRGRHVTPVAMWVGDGSTGGPGTEEKEEEKEEKKDTFWSWPNFKRGHYVREQMGGNLPPSYPVIAYYSGGHARSIKSVDLTAPTWQDSFELQLQIRSWAAMLRDFDGTKAPWGKDGINIRPGDIRSRELMLVIPSNSPPELVQVVENLRGELSAMGVKLTVVQKEKSWRYEKEADEEEEDISP